MIARQVSFFAPAAVMSAWAIVMLHTVATGRITQLLSPIFRGYVVIAAGALIVLSALYVLLYQPGAEPAPRGWLRQLGRWVVLLVPLVAASVLSPSALSSTTLQNRASTSGAYAMPSLGDESRAKAKEALAADPTQAVPIEVTELLTLAKTPDQARAFENRKVKTVGLIAQPPGQPPKVLRWIMWCCAADALPAAVDLAGPVTGTYKDTDWLEVTGTAHFVTKDGKTVPQIAVDTIAPTQEPDEPFLSP